MPKPNAQSAAPKLRSGDADYRAYIGGPGRYDILAGAQFSFLLDVGLRDEHRVLDIGCGSLRLGRLLIPFLQADRYFGVEPHEWLVEAGFERELGHDIKELKRPRFRFVDDFSLDGFGERFDLVMAYSVFTHCYPDLAEHGLRQVARTLAPRGVLVATFVENTLGDEGSGELLAANGTGWLYPRCVRYTWKELAGTLKRAGLVGHLVSRPTAHRQQWFVASRREDRRHSRRAALAASRGEPRNGSTVARTAASLARREPRAVLRAARNPRAAVDALRHSVRARDGR
jgi:SAM-dependent methyltransferase